MFTLESIAEYAVISIALALLLPLCTFKMLGALQQAGYDGKRFAKWSVRKGNMVYSRYILLAFLVALSSAVLAVVFSFTGMWAAYISLLPFPMFVAVYCRADKRALKVPLVYTGRAQRVYALECVCVFVAAALLTLGVNAASYYAEAELLSHLRYLPLAVLPILLPLLLRLANAIDAPFSEAKNRKYVAAAREKLRAMGVDSPRVARVSNSLAQHGLVAPGEPCLTVAEAKRLVAGIVGGTASTTPHGEKNLVPARPSRPRAAQGEPVVSFRDVSFTYPSTGAAVRDLTYEVYPGEIVGVIGQNGAGKTTLTKLLNGILHPDSGEVRVAGLDTRETPTSRLAAHVSTLFQNPDRQICKDTVLDEVAFGLELTGVGGREARRRASAVIERFGLPADEAPFSLSRGQRQMVALASVVVMEPDVVLLDEPTSGLDYRECMTVMETVAEMAARGCAVVMVCHDMEVVSDFAERLVVMARGEIVGRGTATEVFSDAALMARAGVEPPQIVALSTALAEDVSPAFAGIAQVSGIVDLVEEMVRRD